MVRGGGDDGMVLRWQEGEVLFCFKTSLRHSVVALWL
jgi:hypothetical protein